MSLSFTPQKRMLFSSLILAAFFTLLILRVAQTNAEREVAAAQSPVSFAPTYVLRHEVQHEMPNFGSAVADPERRRIYAAYWYGYITIIDAATGVVETTLTDVHRPESMLLSPDGSQLYISSNVTGFEDGRITILDTGSLSVIAAHVYPNPNGYPHYSGVRGMALGPNGRLHIAPMGDYLGNSIDTMDIASGSIVATLPFTGGFVLDLASHDDALYATHLDYSNAETSLMKFNISTGVPVSETAVSLTEAGSITVSPDGVTVLVRSNEGTVNQYNAATLELIRTYSVEYVLGYIDAAISADSQSLTGLFRPNGFYSLGALHTFDLQTGQLQRSYMDWGEMSPVYHTVTLAEGDVGLIYAEGVRVFAPADYSVALPVVLDKYCGSSVVDDFSNPGSGWPIHDTGSVIYRYLDNEYNIYHRQGDRWGAVSRGDVWNRSKLVEVKGRLVQNQGAWGLLLGLNNDWTNFYTFEIIPDEQRWFIFYYNSSLGWQVIGQGSSAAIQSGTAVNRLTIREGNANLEFRINGTVVEYRYDLFNLVGRVGLTGASLQTNVDIRFDDYIFTAQGCPLPGQSVSSVSVGESVALERPDVEELLANQQAP